MDDDFYCNEVLSGRTALEEGHSHGSHADASSNTKWGFHWGFHLGAFRCLGAYGRPVQLEAV